jgi:hypothetical protein
MFIFSLQKRLKLYGKPAVLQREPLISVPYSKILESNFFIFSQVIFATLLVRKIQDMGGRIAF